MTTNETTARDRAAVAIGALANTTNENAEKILSWLQSNPEVLRALAGVPDQTADRAAIERVRARHQPDGGDPFLPYDCCTVCADDNGGPIAYPCPTVRALDGDAGEEEWS